MSFEMKVFHEDDAFNTGLQISCRNIIDFFSVNDKGVYCANGKQLKYMHYKVSDLVKVSFDLKRGSDSVVKKSHANVTWNKLNNMFIWISLNSSRLRQLGEVAFITFRGNLTKIMCSPYETKDDWTICARYSNGIIYLNSFDTENDTKKREAANSFQLNCEVWGFKFEQYMLSDNPKIKPDPSRVLNENEEFNCVFDRTLGSHRLIYGAEMDGIFSNEILDLGKDNALSDVEFVELKTSRCVERHDQDRSLRRYKMLKWWCQSYLAGVETVVCGFRDDSGIVRTLQSYKVKEFPTLAQGLWDCNVCISFCVRFLSFVKRIVLGNNNETNDVWKFDFIPKHKILATKVTDDTSIYKDGFRQVMTQQL